MTGALRTVTIVLALVYFGAAVYHSGLVVAAGALTPASIAEALLGIVLAVTAAGVIAPRLGYVFVLAGTLFGLTIVVLRGLLGVDLWIHVAMLAGLAIGFALIFTRRTA
jgi:hypothetical protein